MHFICFHAIALNTCFPANTLYLTRGCPTTSVNLEAFVDFSTRNLNFYGTILFYIIWLIGKSGNFAALVGNRLAFGREINRNNHITLAKGISPKTLGFKSRLRLLFTQVLVLMTATITGLYRYPILMEIAVLRRG